MFKLFKGIALTKTRNGFLFRFPKGFTLFKKMVVKPTTTAKRSLKSSDLFSGWIDSIFKTNKGSILFDVGFGPARPSFSHNAERLGFNLDQVDALVISHLHGDHMGGMAAQRSRRVTVPEELMPSKPKPCFIPDNAETDGFNSRMIKKPGVLPAGIVTTGPLARSLFIFGYTEEQALVAKIKRKGLVIFTGCGHPTIELIVKMVRRLSNEPIYAIGGGLHFPISDGRGNSAGIRFQTIIGTGKPVWQRITDKDLGRTISAINSTTPKKVYLSGHDICDHALGRMERELEADTEVLTAGKTYRF